MNCPPLSNPEPMVDNELPTLLIFFFYMCYGHNDTKTAKMLIIIRLSGFCNMREQLPVSACCSHGLLLPLSA